MDKEIKNLCSRIIKTAQDEGANECKATIARSRNVTIRYRNHKPEVIKEATTQSLFLEVYLKGKYAFQSTPDLRQNTLGDFIKKLILNAGYLEEDPYRSLPDSVMYEGRSDADIQIYDPAYNDFSPEQRHSLIQDVENACLDMGGEKIISVDAEISDQFNEFIALTSNGFEGEAEGTRFDVETNMSAQDEGDRKPQGYSYFGTRLLGDLPAAEIIAKQTIRDTLNQLGAKKIKTEKLPVIIENKNVSRVLSGFLSAMNGQNLQQQSSFLIDKKGKQIGSKLFTIIDDPFIKKGLGSKRFDNDGFPARKRTIIENGILNEYYIDWYYSRKMECDPTTGGSSNLIIPVGSRSVEEIMKDLGRGILVTGFIGGNSNSTTGDFSNGIFGQLFDQGQIVHPVAEMNIADNHSEFWNKLVEVANDPWKYSSRLMPSLVFEDIMVAGG
ncbi:MAG: TldD/PmbA family protein [Bacteroidales bacterium]|nr:TldD/PmbA family protein [Bacteroidales bacterium]